MPGSRRLSQRISEGDGIAIIARMSDVAGARGAEGQGAKAVAVDPAIRESISLPVLWTGAGPAVDADTQAIRPEDEGRGSELETVVAVRDEADLEIALELLHDVPAGKLAIAELEAATRADLLALERAGVDAILVAASRVAGLAGSGS